MRKHRRQIDVGPTDRNSSRAPAAVPLHSTRIECVSAYSTMDSYEYNGRAHIARMLPKVSACLSAKCAQVPRVCVCVCRALLYTLHTHTVHVRVCECVYLICEPLVREYNILVHAALLQRLPAVRPAGAEPTTPQLCTGPSINNVRRPMNRGVYVRKTDGCV